MRAERDRQLLAAVAAFLRQQNYEGVAYDVRVRIDGQRWDFEQGADWPEEQVPAPARRGRLLSLDEQRIVDWLDGLAAAGDGYVTGDSIAQGLVMNAARCKLLLSNLADREVIESQIGPGGGYRSWRLKGSASSGG
jgi:hypothetical protein